MQPKVYNTPKRHCVIKTQLTETERADFEQRCATLSNEPVRVYPTSHFTTHYPRYPGKPEQRGTSYSRFTAFTL